MPGDTRPPEVHELYVGEEAIVYCVSFEDDPSVTGGATLASPTILSVENGKVTVGNSPQINSAADFVQYDRDGATALHTVAMGKGVKIAVTGVSRGSCEVAVKVVASDGQKPVGKVVFKVL